jgi:adenosylmethionine-8-amino-7-oxononanoate aminotransferase
LTTLLKPYTAPGRSHGLKIIGGDGCYVTDSSGRRYLDAAGGLWNLTLGLGNKVLVETIATQAKALAYAQLFDATHAPAERLADALVTQYGGGMSYAYLSTTGSSAVEIALTAAKLHHRVKGDPTRRRIVTLDRGYHGSSSMARAASGALEQELSIWGLHQPEFLRIPSCVDEAGSLKALSELVADKDHGICALLMEPILGTGGIYVPTKAYCKSVSDLCEQHGVLLIADEVATGGGRCGRFFASQELGLRPAAVALSKGLTSGYLPLAATLFSEEMMRPMVETGTTLPFGSTQDGNPIACATALATLEIVTQPEMVQRIEQVGETLRTGLQELIGSGVVSEVRGMGLMVGVELKHIGNNRQLFTETEAAAVKHQCREEGLLVYHFDGGLSLFPSLMISDDEIADLIEMLSSVLAEQL